MTKLLIVDDELDVREFAANFFRRRKIDVVTAANGADALAAVGEHKPKLVLLDIKMDGIDGVETLRLIKELDKQVKVIMVSGRKPEEENSFTRCSQMGALHYIHKPLELNELEKIVLKELNKE